jgi:hypothetical protein
MKPPIPIYLAVEDELSEWVARRALATQSPRFAVGPVFQRGGYGYLKKQAAAFNNAAKGCPFLVLTDLDEYACPPELIAEWLTVPKQRHFLLRVAVREVESWLLGDAPGLSQFLGLRQPIAVSQPEALEDPKRELLQASMKCPRRTMRDALVWHDEKSGRLFQGPDYNGALAPFVNGQWDIGSARQKCPSLESFLAALGRLETEYGRRIAN